MSSLATAFVSIRPDMTGFGARLSKSTNLSAEKAGADAGNRLTSKFKSALKVGGILAGAFAVTKGVGFLKESIGAASDLGETVNKSNVIFGKNAGEINKWAKTAATSLGLSRQAALESAAGFGDMFSQIGFSSGQATKMSKSVVKLSADLGSFNNLPTAEVNDMIAASFRGEYDSLQRVIPNINAARVEKEALAATGKKVAKSLTAEEKAAATLAIINRDGSRAVGDFARTSDGLANSQKIAGARVDDLKASVGKGLLPAVTTVTNFFSNRVLPAVQGFVTGMQDGTGAGGKLAAILRTVWKALSATVGFLVRNKEAVATFVAVLGGFLIISKITKAVAAFNVVLAANPIGLVVVAVAAFAAGLVIAYKRSETFRNIVDKAWAGVKRAVSSAWQGVIKPALKAFGGFITGTLAPVIRGFWNNVVKPVFKGIGATIGFMWRSVVKPIFAAFRAYLTGVVFPVIRFLWNNVVKPIFKGVGATISFTWKNVIKPVFRALRDGVDGVRAAFRAAIDAVGRIWSSLQGMAKRPVRFVVNTVFAGMVKVLNKIPGVDLPVPHVKFAKGGWTGPGSMLQPAGEVHADEFVVKKSSRRKIEQYAPGLLDKMNEWGDKALHGPLRKLPGYFLGGGVVPMAGATSIRRHSGYPWARWAGDLNGAGDDTGKAALAYKAGVVAATRSISGSYGNHVKINHAGNEKTLYAHLSAFGPGPGSRVTAGQRIGSVGSTGNSSGPHLHFELAGGSNPIGSGRGSKASGGGTDSYFDTVRKYPNFKDPTSGIRARIGGWKDKLSGMGEWGQQLASLPGKLFSKISAPGGYIAKKISSALSAVKKVAVKVAQYQGAGPSAPTGQLVPAMKAAYKFAAETLGIKTIYGYSNRNIGGTSTKSDHAYGKALDLMGAKQNVADYFATGPGHSKFNIENTIYNRRIHNARGWHAYNGASPHTDHVHIDTYDKGGVAAGRGALVKNTLRPERVLSPRQTVVYEELLAELKSGRGRGPMVHVENQYTNDPEAAARATRMEQMKALALMGTP